MRISPTVVALGVAAVTAVPASAALVTVGGAFVGTFGSTEVLGMNGQSSVAIDGAISGAAYSGVVSALNADNGCNFTLSLTEFAFSSARTTPVTLTVTIVQDYAAAAAAGWVGAHQFSGSGTFTNAGQAASIASSSLHESTNLPALVQSQTAGGPGTVAFNRDQGPATTIGAFDETYRITTTYTFVLTRGSSGSVTINLPDSGVDQATCVPSPASGLPLAGMLGIVGAARRRRRIGR